MIPEIIYESDAYVVINKPAGLVVHSDGITDEPSVVDWFIHTYPESIHVGESAIREHKGEDLVLQKSGVVHRLDRDTSGVMILARTQESFEFLKSKFQEHAIRKEYHAFVYGHVKQDEGIIEAPIGKSRSDFRRYSASHGARGILRPAETAYRVVRRFMDDKGNPFSFVIFYPHTGRTHQIRVHAKYMNHPLVGDALYSGKRIHEGTLGFARQALHARSISWVDSDHRELSYEAQYPSDFKEVLSNISE